MASPQNTLGIAPPESALFYIVCSPVGPYYKGGFKPIKLLVNEGYSRAWKGGTGQFKLGRSLSYPKLKEYERAKEQCFLFLAFRGNPGFDD